jgi:hypothetical protein
MNSGIIDHTGEIYSLEKKERGTVITAQNGKFLLTRRSPTLSNASAITKISEYGIARVFYVSATNILQQYLEFTPSNLGLDDLATLIKQIHSVREKQGTLVHGDFSRQNTTRYQNKPYCFDYEHTHWGDPYIDLGRIVLRECKSEEEVKFFFEKYQGSLPSLYDMREGFISFCQRQYEMRHEKDLDFKEVPMIRGARLKKACNNNLAEILNAFKAPVVI